MRNLVAAGCLIASSPVIAEVTEKISYTYYEANAEHSRSLEKILNDASPHREGSQVFYGTTDWTVAWQLEGIETPAGKCRITKVVTELSVVIDLPKLVGGTPEQTDLFDKLLAALKTHELGHYAIARQAADAVDSKVRSLPQMAGCQSLTAAASAVASQTIDEFKATEKQYDVTTHHGETQGAWLSGERPEAP